MSENQPKNRVEDANKAWEMAHAEKPFRDSKIEFLAERKQQFADRFTEIKEMVNDGSAELTNIKPNEDEQAYAADGVVESRGYFGNIGRPMDTDPANTARIAKALMENDSVRTHRVATTKERENDAALLHPQSLAIIKQKDKIAQRFSFTMRDDYGPSRSSVGGKDNKAALKLNKALNAKIVDPSRSHLSDWVGDEAGKKYDEHQKLKEDLKEVV